MNKRDTIKIFICDLNWIYVEEKTCNPFIPNQIPSAPHDWAFINPKEYFDWTIDRGANAIWLQAYTFCGYAFYPTKLGAVAPGPGQELLPAIYEMCKKEKIPFHAYFCVGSDLIMTNMRDDWVLPGSRSHKSWYFPQGFLAPESPWTDLLCERIEEFLKAYPSDWIFLDWFGYGSIKTDYPVQPAWFIKKPFKEIIGREMPEDASNITYEENLKYKREILSRQFYKLKITINKTSPKTKIVFNMPYWNSYDPLWIDHPVMNESDMLFAESSDENVVNWLLKVRKPNQRVMTTVLGRIDTEGLCDPNSWEKWYSLGCDIFGVAIPTPPDFRPPKYYSNQIKIIFNAFKKIK